jgi:hypothetical protein
MSTSRDGRRAMSVICSTVSGWPLSSPPLKPRVPVVRWKSVSAFAASAASPRTKVMAVGPCSMALRSGVPAWSAASSVSVFFTTRNEASASRRRLRSSAAAGTEMPR